ncbi:MAG: nucleotide exchange factor GrpE, partial [Bacilli bacterium]
MTKDEEYAVGNEEEQSTETETNDLQTETASEVQEEQEMNEAPLSEVDQWKAQADENYQRFLRVQADFDNFRRRSRQEREESAKYASLKVVESLLPALDNFERALSANK